MVNNISGFADSNFNSGGSLTQLAQDFDDFLQLLTTQLENQDPTSPLDANEFTQQIVSFSEVEQSIQTNNNLKALIDLQVSNQIGNAVNFAGKEVEIKADAIALREQGNAEFAYINQRASEETRITIRNGEGRIVFTGDGQLAPGRHNVEWDRRDSAGNLLPAGLYSVEVKAKYTGSEFFEPVDTFYEGTVTGVNLGNDDLITIFVDDQLEVPLTEIFFVSEPKPEPVVTDAPVITGFSGSVTYNPEEGPVSIDSDLSIIDDDGSILTRAIVTIDNIKNGEDEVLEVGNLPEGITVESLDNGVLVLSGLATLAQYAEALRSITYENTSDEPDTSDRTISITVSDGNNASNTVSKTIIFGTGEEGSGDGDGSDGDGSGGGTGSNGGGGDTNGGAVNTGGTGDDSDNLPAPPGQDPSGTLDDGEI